MSEPYDTDPRRSGASRARHPHDAAPDAYADPSGWDSRRDPGDRGFDTRESHRHGRDGDDRRDAGGFRDAADRPGGYGDERAHRYGDAGDHRQAADRYDGGYRDERAHRDADRYGDAGGHRSAADRRDGGYGDDRSHREGYGDERARRDGGYGDAGGHRDAGDGRGAYQGDRDGYGDQAMNGYRSGGDRREAYRDDRDGRDERGQDVDGEAAPAEPARSHGRAGRNVPVSIAVAVGLLAVILTPLFFFKPAFLVILVAAAALGVWEMARAVRTSGAQPPLIPLIGGAVAMMCLAWFSGVDALSIGLLITVLATMVWRMGDGPAGYQRDMGAAALIMVYVPFLLGFAAVLTTPEDGKYRIVATLAAVVLSDTGGFVAGVLFGKHPMAPTISPKKSWEGFAGSIVATAAGSAAILWALLDVAPWWGAAFGVVVSIAAVLGDLAESLLKRDLGIKDMSNILPGHGGIMDRLDSIVFAVPTAYLLLSVLAPVS